MSLDVSFLAATVARVSAAEGSAVLIVIGIIVAVVAIIYGAQQEKKAQLAWAKIAAQYGLDQTGKFDLSGKVGDFAVAADVYTTGSGKNRQTWTRVTLTGNLTRAVALASEGFFSRVFGQDIMVGDPGFDQTVKVQGDEAAALALLDQHTRSAFKSAVASGWSLEDGCWTLKARGRLSEELGSRIEVGLSLAELTKKGQSELPRRLLALVTHDAIPNVRRRALSYLVSQYASSSATQSALQAALRDGEPDVRLLAADRLGDLGVLDALVGSVAVEPRVRVEALEAMVRHGPEDPRTSQRVSEWFNADVPHLFRKAAVEAVARVAVVDAEARLIEVLGAPDDDLKLAAMRSLQAVGTVHAVPFLIPYRDKLLAFTLKGAAKDAILAIQARVAHGDAGALSLAGEGGGLAMAEALSEPSEQGG